MQAIERGVSFRFEDVRSLFFAGERALGGGASLRSPLKARPLSSAANAACEAARRASPGTLSEATRVSVPPLHKLTVNFRSNQVCVRGGRWRMGRGKKGVCSDQVRGCSSGATTMPSQPTLPPLS